VAAMGSLEVVLAGETRRSATGEWHENNVAAATARRPPSGPPLGIELLAAETDAATTAAPARTLILARSAASSHPEPAAGRARFKTRDDRDEATGVPLA